MPRALAVPRPVEGWGLLLMPTAKLSNVHAVRVVAAVAPEREASNIVEMQTIVLRLYMFIIDLSVSIS
jgi:hypothetical protein